MFAIEGNVAQILRVTVEAGASSRARRVRILDPAGVDYDLSLHLSN